MEPTHSVGSEWGGWEVLLVLVVKVAGRRWHSSGSGEESAAICNKADIHKTEDQQKPMVTGPGPITTPASLVRTPSPPWLSHSCHARLSAHQPKASLP